MQDIRADGHTLAARPLLLPGLAVLAVLLGPAALAQPAPGTTGSGRVASEPSAAPGQQAGSGLPVMVGQVRTAAQALRNAQEQLAANGPANLGMARTAVEAGQQAVARVPEQTRNGAARAAAHDSLERAAIALRDQNPSTAAVASQLRVAADMLDVLAARMTDNAAGAGGGSDAAQGGAGAPRRTE